MMLSPFLSKVFSCQINSSQTNTQRESMPFKIWAWLECNHKTEIIPYNYYSFCQIHAMNLIYFKNMHLSLDDKYSFNKRRKYTGKNIISRSIILEAIVSSQLHTTEGSISLINAAVWLKTSRKEDFQIE